MRLVKKGPQLCSTASEKLWRASSVTMVLILPESFSTGMVSVKVKFRAFVFQRSNKSSLQSSRLVVKTLAS